MGDMIRGLVMGMATAGAAAISVFAFKSGAVVVGVVAAIGAAVLTGMFWLPLLRFPRAGGSDD